MLLPGTFVSLSSEQSRAAVPFIDILPATVDLSGTILPKFGDSVFRRAL